VPPPVRYTNRWTALDYCFEAANDSRSGSESLD